MKVTFLSGVGAVTGANFLLETESSKILIDCGLTQGEVDSESENQSRFAYSPAQMDFLFVTHSHLDHIGRIPKLVKDGFKGAIFSTPETKAISEVMFQDAYKVMEYESKEKGTPMLYGKEDVFTALSLWHDLPYHEKRKMADFEVVAKDAGHILGSTMYEFSSGGKTIVFTGDLGNSPSLLLRDTEPITDADYMVMESVYGDKNHESKEDREKRFEETLREALSRGGTLLIPAFSLERTQVILYQINELFESRKIAPVPVFLDSPLAIKVTAIYEKISAYYNSGVRQDIASGDDIFKFPTLKSIVRSFDSFGLDKVPNPKIIIAGSGMSNGGRIVRHEAHYLPDPKNTILLLGYQATGTLGRQIQEGVKNLKINGVNIQVCAKVVSINGYSSHKDSDHLIEFAGWTKPKIKKIFVVMGEPKSSSFLAQRLRDYEDIDAVCPERGKTYELK